MRIRSFAKRMPPSRVFGEWGQGLITAAETCADCGECEARCPYELPIREVMRENIAWYHAMENVQTRPSAWHPVMQRCAHRPC